LHPASRIVTYLLAALVIPGLPFFILPILLLLPLAVFALRREHPLRLVWRTRWLILILLLGYAYSLPGVPVIDWLGDWSPSLPGLLRGGQQVLRLVILLMWLDLLVLRMPVERLMAGLHTLLQPLRLLGVNSERVTLRLGLTLRAIENLERGRGNLARLLEEPAEPGEPVRVKIMDLPLKPLDFLPPLLVVGVALATWLNA